MRLINVEALLERERLIRQGKRVDRRARVLEFLDDEVTEYAILSHRWTVEEVGYEEIVELAKMDMENIDEIRQRDGYQKILCTCEQAKKDRYEWLWVDTCCIDKRSSAELSEAIRSMYRWYENAKICYAYLHDVPGPSFPIAPNAERYPQFNGWPEWFSRGWTLQHMIAPRNVLFFNKQWQAIGDKRTLAPTLERITGVPEDILTDGLSGNRPCVAQIMSWAANRTTTRVEDRAYSLMGLLGVNIPMSYGEGKEAFHRLQLEIIRTSNDQSIFAWSWNEEVRTGNILADDPSVFRRCSQMELMNPDEFIKSLREQIPEELDWIGKDRLGTFLITNRGIQIWMFLCPIRGSDSVFRVWLPCRPDPWSRPVTINLCEGESNYYRYTRLDLGSGTLQFREVYLSYQTWDCNATFTVDDNAVTKNGFTYQRAYPVTSNMFTLTDTNPLCVKVYSNDETGDCFAVGFGQFLGKGWIHVESGTWDFLWEECNMLARAPEYARSMDKTRSEARVCIMQTRLHQLTLRTCVVWEGSNMNEVQLEVFRDPSFDYVSGEWRILDVDVSGIFSHYFRISIDITILR